MSIRARILAVAIGVTVPAIVVLVVSDVRSRRAVAEAELATLVRGEIGKNTADSCTDPRTFQGFRPGPPDAPPPVPTTLPTTSPANAPGPPRPPNGPPRPPPSGGPPGAGPATGPALPMRRHSEPMRMFAYDADGRSPRDDAPKVTAADLEDARTNEWTSVTGWTERRYIEVLIHTGWEGPCAYIGARGTTEDWLGALLPAPQVWLTPILLVIAVVGLAMGPLVTRLRRLTRAVHQFADDEYRGTVPTSGQDEIGELGRAFAQVGQRVQEELAARAEREAALERFIADTTHDVMVPITVLQSHLSRLREAAAAGEVCRSSDVAAAMQESHYIGALLRNLAADATLDSQRSHRDPVDLAALVRRVESRHRTIARELGISLECGVADSPVLVTGDETLLEQAVNNLVYNAIRHNGAREDRDEGHVALVLDTLGRDDERHFRLRVLDDGPGIPASERAALLTRGTRGPERSRDGQGLGLDIAHRIVREHGFQLTFDDPPDGPGLIAEIHGPLRAESSPG